jgi:hypothetical protein
MQGGPDLGWVLGDGARSGPCSWGRAKPVYGAPDELHVNVVLTINDKGAASVFPIE